MSLLVAEVSDFSTRTRLGVVFVGFGGAVSGAVVGVARAVFFCLSPVARVGRPACLSLPLAVVVSDLATMTA